MDANGPANTLNTRVQPTIRSFFQPGQPSYTAPPSLPVSKPGTSVPPTSLSQTPPSAAQIPQKTTPTLPHQVITSSTIQPQRSSTLPLQATISPVLEQHIQPLRRINSLLLPIHYPDSFYHKILSPDAPISFSRTILWTSTSPAETKIIGGIICRLDPALSPLSKPQAPLYIEGAYDIYIQSLALLSPYRSKGLAAEVLQEIIEAAVGQNEVRVASLYAHVWTENEEGLNWYAARGFKREEPVLHGYYRRLKPDTAWILRRRLMPTDHLVSLPSQIPQTSPTPPPAPASAPIPAAVRPAVQTSARSFQERGPDREWNDLPEDVLGNVMLKPPSHLGSREGSAASSRSSSRSGIEGKGKKKRVYPAAAFGS
jgi:ribosomal protein S18 acetylase RimI-like enzyme